MGLFGPADIFGSGPLNDPFFHNQINSILAPQLFSPDTDLAFNRQALFGLALPTDSPVTAFPPVASLPESAKEPAGFFAQLFGKIGGGLLNVAGKATEGLAAGFIVKQLEDGSDGAKRDPTPAQRRKRRQRIRLAAQAGGGGAALFAFAAVGVGAFLLLRK